MYEPRLEAEALSEACGVPTLRLDHAARLGQPLLVLVSVHGIQQVGVAGELDQIRMGGDQGSHQWMSASCAARRSATWLRSWSVMACPHPPQRQTCRSQSRRLLSQGLRLRLRPDGWEHGRIAGVEALRVTEPARAHPLSDFALICTCRSPAGCR